MLTHARFGLLVALLAGFEAKGAASDTPHLIDVSEARLVDAAGLALEVSGGVWISDSEAQRVSQQIRSLRAENDYLTQHAGDLPATWLLGVGLAALAVGLLGGWLLARLYP